MTGQGADGSQGGSVQPGTAKIEALKPSKNWECHGTNIIYVCIYICMWDTYLYIYTYIHVGYIFIYIYTYTYGMCMYNYIYTHIIHMGYI
jgi:hypothetical protein